MIAEMPTRKVVKMLQDAGWTLGRTRGSHGTWKCPTGTHQVVATDGHRITTAGVVRKIQNAIADCTCTDEEPQP